MTWVYRLTECSLDHQLWTVGYYAPDGEWVSDSDHSAKEAAAARVRWLNGGS